MAAFTDEAGPLEFAVSVPAVRSESSSVDQVPGIRWFGRSSETLPHLHQQRGEPSIESDHDSIVASRIHCGQNPIELVKRQGQWLFDEDGLSSLECAARHARRERCAG